MTLKLTPEALAQVNAILATSDPQRFAEAYGVVNADLQSTYGGLELNANDHDVVQWLGIAEQVNSGSESLIAVAIRMNNKVASLIETGRAIDLFGPEQQNASNRIAKGFFDDIQSDGTLPDFATIGAKSKSPTGSCPQMHSAEKPPEVVILRFVGETT
jgi:hypothetical protein